MHRVVVAVAADDVAEMEHEAGGTHALQRGRTECRAGGEERGHALPPHFGVAAAFREAVGSG